MFAQLVKLSNQFRYYGNAKILWIHTFLVKYQQQKTY